MGNCETNVRLVENVSISTVVLGRLPLLQPETTLRIASLASTQEAADVVDDGGSVGNFLVYEMIA